MRINVAVPEADVTAPVLNAALEGVTRLNQQLLKSGRVPPFERVLHRLRWKPEPPGQEHFDHAALVLARGHGDCDDLAPYHAATLRATGRDRGARAIVRRSGPNKWHAVVRRSDGRIDDPSTAAGMPGRGMGTNPAMPLLNGGAIVGGAFDATRPRLAVRPFGNRHGRIEAWQARADLPWHVQPGNSPADVALASLHASPVSDQAIVGALRGALRVCGANPGLVSGDNLTRVAAVLGACDGMDYHELVEEYGPEHARAAVSAVNGLFGDIAKVVKSGVKTVAKPLKKAWKKVEPAAKVVFPAPYVATKHWKKAAPAIPGGSMAVKAEKLVKRALKDKRAGRKRPPARPVTRRRKRVVRSRPATRRARVARRATRGKYVINFS